ncbi:MAG TPA: amidohydrolase family protein [Candidatus Sulfotelmatobacter sp.]|jgi:N-acetylglucosamine-6-phosphate deacetylase|nr:amidohydrolase family protein [Candidatus Sulfotelmatobacter sp.]
MLPGLFDIQVNGFAGVDFQKCGLTGTELRQAVDGLAAHQTQRFFATLITDSLDALAEKFANLERLRAADEAVSEAVCGYHLEGPWLSPEPGYCGAHEARHMTRPDVRAFERLQRAAGGNIRLVTLAPELPGSAELIRAVVDSGAQVSLGHTRAEDADIDAAMEAGARFCTHLGNGVPQQLHRHDNVVQRLLARDELAAFFIPDGIHLPPWVLKNFFHAKPAGKALFTTDCMAAAGAATGHYTLGNLMLEVGEDRVVHQPGGKNFAGSALCPDEGVRNLEKWLGLDAAAARILFSTAIAKMFDIQLPTLSHDQPKHQIL